MNLFYCFSFLLLLLCNFFSFKCYIWLFSVVVIDFNCLFFFIRCSKSYIFAVFHVCIASMCVVCVCIFVSESDVIFSLVYLMLTKMYDRNIECCSQSSRNKYRFCRLAFGYSKCVIAGINIAAIRTSIPNFCKFYQKQKKNAQKGHQ